LWKDWEEGGPGIAQRRLLEAAGSDSTRLNDLFRRSSAWRTLIVSRLPGVFALAPLPGQSAFETGRQGGAADADTQRR
jgi:hypothetical protein